MTGAEHVWGVQYVCVWGGGGGGWGVQLSDGYLISLTLQVRPIIAAGCL